MRLAIKLNDPKTAPKTLWSILKTFVNSSVVPLIPLLLVNNDFLTDFLVKQTCLITFSENNVDLTQMAALFRTIRSLKLQLDFQTLTLTLVLLLNFVHLVMAVMAQNLFIFFF